MRLFISILSAIVLIAFSYSYAVAGQKKFNKTFPVTPGGKLIVNTDVGSLHVVGTSENTVSVTADIEGSDKAIVFRPYYGSTEMR